MEQILYGAIVIFIAFVGYKAFKGAKRIEKTEGNNNIFLPDKDDEPNQDNRRV